MVAVLLVVSRRRKRLLSLGRRAGADDVEGGEDVDDADSAEEELEKLERELEAMEDQLGLESEERASALQEKVEGIAAKAPAAREFTATPAGASPTLVPMGRVAVCTSGSSVGELLLARLRDAASLGVAEPLQVDLGKMAGLNFDEVLEVLDGCTSAVICADVGDETPEALAQVLNGLKAVLSGTPDSLQRLVLLSRIGAQQSKGGFNLGSFFGESHQTSWDDIEDELTKTARTRTASKPLYAIIVRAGVPRDAGQLQVTCLPASTATEAGTTVQSCAEALFQALALQVDAGFAVVDEPVAEPSPPVWSELLLPFVGPEIWRADVDNARRAAIFVQGWAEEFFAEGKRASRVGVKTPVQLRKTPAGVILKFRPLGTEPDFGFDDLSEGGVEFIAEEPATGPARLRARRCAYGWKVSVKENSERALLQKFEKDWNEVSTA